MYKKFGFMEFFFILHCEGKKMKKKEYTLNGYTPQITIKIYYVYYE